MKNLPLLSLIFLISCSSSKSSFTVKTHTYPLKVDTRSRTIDYQEKKTYTLDGISVSNNFPGARLNNFNKLSDSTYQATITPENSPINESPWYAFKIWANQDKTINIKLNYEGHKHRYNPKISKDGENWSALDINRIKYKENSSTATIKLDVTKDTLWVAAQEIQDSKRVGDWVGSFKNKEFITIGSAGQSALGKPLYFMNITEGDYKKKPAIIIISRQHPPEVTGYLAMRSFVETLINEGSKNGFLNAYRVMVYPLLNPDGVDLGHYRHNTGGVDLNRD